MIGRAEIPLVTHLMAVLVGIYDNRPLPSEQEIAEASTEDDGDTEPDVVRHHNKHEQVAHCYLH